MHEMLHILEHNGDMVLKSIVLRDYGQPGSQLLKSGAVASVRFPFARNGVNEGYGDYRQPWPLDQLCRFTPTVMG
jgi:hypothetical protein